MVWEAWGKVKQLREKYADLDLKGAGLLLSCKSK